MLSALPDEITNMQRKTQKVIKFHVTSVLVLFCFLLQEREAL